MGLLDFLKKPQEDHLIASPFMVERDGLLLHGTMYRSPEASAPLTPIILCHGFMSSAKQETESYAKKLAGWGYAAFVFDFAGGGPKSTSEGSFSEMTVFTEVKDLEAMIGYVCGLPDVDAGKLTLLGCSQGGVVSALTAAKHPDEVKQLILFYPALCIPDDARSGRMMFFQFDPANIPDRIAASVPGVKLAISGEYPRCVINLDIFEEIAPYHGEVLIIHGEKDRVVNVSYGKRAWQVYRAGRQEQAKEAWAAEHPGMEVPTAVPDPRCHFVQIAGADHGYHGAQADLAIETVKAFLERQTEVLTIDVQLTGRSLERKGKENILRLPFTGSAQSVWFSGTILPGAADVQRRIGFTPVEFAASYEIAGRDFTGTDAKVSIVNRSIRGGEWQPTVRTDSKALAFLNEKPARCIFEGRKEGPVIHIYV